MRLARRLLGPAVFDEMAVVHRVLSDEVGVLVDVGAHEGSSLIDFARAGWVVWAFEPDPKNLSALEGRIRGFPKVHVDPRAISPVDGDVVPLYTSEVSSGISGLMAFHPSHQATTSVATVRLDTFLKERGCDSVTLIKTDTEGFDLPVLQTFPWDVIHPRAIVCEFEDAKTERLGYKHEDLGGFLADLGYEVFISEWWPVSEYGAKHRWRDLRPYPADIRDERSWGNFIAVESGLRSRVETHARSAGRRLRSRRAIERLVGRG